MRAFDAAVLSDPRFAAAILPVGDGLLVATYDLLPVGTELTLSLVLPGGKQVIVSGRVTWIRDPHDGELAPGVGVRFQRLDEDDRAAIDLFLKKRAPMFFES